MGKQLWLRKKILFLFQSIIFLNFFYLVSCFRINIQVYKRGTIIWCNLGPHPPRPPPREVPLYTSVLRSMGRVFSMDVPMSSSALRQETPCSPASAKYSRRKEVMKKRFRSLLNSSPVKCSNMFFSTYFSCGCTETDFYPWLHFVRRENQRDICCSFFQSTCQKCIQHCSEIDIYLYTYFIYVDM